MEEAPIWVDCLGLSGFVFGPALLIWTLVFKNRILEKEGTKDFYGGILFSILLILMALLTYLRRVQFLDATTFAILTTSAFYTAVILFFVLGKLERRRGLS
ncbi:MAG: hypothetical protein QXY92_05055 [Archaeoglobaceae archaeon]